MILHDGDLETWIRCFSDVELSRNGWSYESLFQNCLKNPRIVRRSDDASIEGLISFMRPTQDIVEVLFLGTSPRYRQRGIMGQLLDQFLRQEAGRQIWLECREDNLNARHLYLKKGFRETGRRPKYYRDGSAAILFNF